ncbi:hypothetical protein BI081_gp201 [Mycobacterium phage Tonenili]|uniref:Uncharacterized protein n=1 Tax=Mycobacterium phage Tonenili TaxID=1891703 RepID=A0A1C9EHG9_9CAUD|nr:hypothetical protein BI081_gp201 [Mycobacterium phage Tonenili]AON96906.1 hypothetical protein SEA_TONENILI_159 [Mycobacterium phage Tonenili]
MKKLVTGGVLAAGLTLGLFGAAPASAEYMTNCPSGLSAVVTANTSCGFADNVFQAFYNQPGWDPVAYSPATGKVYRMHCTPAITTSWGEAKRCWGVGYGGDLLVVYID